MYAILSFVQTPHLIIIASYIQLIPQFYVFFSRNILKVTYNGAGTQATEITLILIRRVFINFLNS